MIILRNLIIGIIFTFFVAGVASLFITTLTRKEYEEDEDVDNQV